MRNLFIITLVVVLAFSAVTFADAPPPPPSHIVVHILNNGVNELSVNQLTYHCTTDNESKEKQISLTCISGICTNNAQYIGSICQYFPLGYFSYVYQNQTRSSESFNNSKIGFDYEYQLELNSGNVTKLNSTPYNPNYHGTFDNPVDNQVCAPFFFMGLLFVGVFLRSKV